jgi:hypothetical protein
MPVAGRNAESGVTRMVVALLVTTGQRFVVSLLRMRPMPVRTFGAAKFALASVTESPVNDVTVPKPRLVSDVNPVVASVPLLTARSPYDCDGSFVKIVPGAASRPPIAVRFAAGMPIDDA